jgi:hypothetical protein
MAPQYKFAVVVRLIEEIISAAADGMLPLAACADVVADALELLGIPEMQIDVKRGLPAAGEEALDDGTGSQARTSCSLAHAPGRSCCALILTACWASNA